MLIDKLAGGRQRTFADTCDIAPSTLNGIVGTRQSDPSSSVINKILDSYPNVNISWLVLGVGEIFKENKSTEYTQGNRIESSNHIRVEGDGECKLCELKNREILLLEREIKALKGEVEALKGRVEDKDELIKNLRM